VTAGAWIVATGIETGDARRIGVRDTTGNRRSDSPFFLPREFTRRVRDVGDVFVTPFGSAAPSALIAAEPGRFARDVLRAFRAWYYGTISQIQVVYGSLTTAIAVLLSVELAAIVLLFGAQVIAEYERLGRRAGSPAAIPLHT
jgi:hypothetical protein